MATKEITGYVKLQLKAGQATPGGSLSTILGSKGLGGQTKKFCDDFNTATKNRVGELIPVVITIYADKSISFITKSATATNSILRAINVEKGSGVPNQTKVGTIKRDKIRAIAENKIKDLNARTVESAMKIIEGTARSIGVTVVD